MEEMDCAAHIALDEELSVATVHVCDASTVVVET